VTSSWQRRIDRANALARADQHAAALLTQYAAILSAQAACYDTLVSRGDRLTGSLERDLEELRPRAAEVFGTIAAIAPAQTMREAPTDVPGIEALLRDGWHVRDIPFLPRLVLQPYAEALATLRGRESTDPPSLRLIDDRGLEHAPGRAACPVCGGPPQVGVLRSDSSADGGGRALVCATCSTNWPVRRIVCPHCGEEDERRLGYFHTSEVDHVRIDACATCRRYLKTIDLTRLGIAVPVVDEVASGALDIWAQERGYTKVTQNLIGL
jgi:FdhE protein